MESKNQQTHLQNWGRLLAGAVATGFAIYMVVRLQKILLLFYLALLLGLAINPLIVWFERRRISRVLVVIGLAIIYFASLVAAGFWVVPPAIAQAQALMDHFPDYSARAQHWVQGALHRYPEIRSRLTADSGSIQNTVMRGTNLLKELGAWAVGFGGLVFSGFLLFFLVLYGLIRPQPMANALFSLTPPHFHDRIERTLTGVQSRVVAWAGGTLILMAIVGFMVWMGLLVLRVPQALLFGIIAAVGEAIPNVGPVLSAIPPIAVLLLTDPVKAVGVVALFIIVQQLENNVIVPMVMGNRLNVHPWALIFMMLVMGDLFGLIGVFLATPTTAILGVIYDELIPKPGNASDVPSSLRVSRAIGGENGDFT
jgi:predicted PurR-regulated permease PerM